MQGFSRADYDIARQRLRNLAVQTNKVEKRHAKVTGQTPLKPKFASDEEVEALSDLQSKLDEVVMSLVTAGLRKGRENSLVDAVRTIQSDMKIFFKAVRTERARVEKQAEDAELECQQKAASVVEQSENAIQTKLDALNRKLELTTKGAKQQRAHLIKQHDHDITALRTKLTSDAEVEMKRLQERLEMSFERQQSQMEEMWQERLNVMERDGAQETSSKLSVFAEDRRRLELQLAESKTCLRDKEQAVSILEKELAAERRAREEDTLRSVHQQRVADVRVQQALAQLDDANSQRDDILTEKREIQEEMREREHSTRAKYNRQMQELRRRKQEQLDEVMARVKKAVGQKQAENARLAERLHAAEDRAAKSEQLLQQLDEGFIGDYEPPGRSRD